MLHYRDFVPREISASGFLRPGEYESFDHAVAAANEWLENASVTLLKIETVVLPSTVAGKKGPETQRSGPVEIRLANGINSSGVGTPNRSPIKQSA